MENIETTEEDVKEQDDFERRMAAARKLLEKEGRYTGLCPSCFDTKKQYKRAGKFWGIEYKKEGDVVQFVKCACGQDVAEEYNF